FPAPVSAVFRLNDGLVEQMSELVGMLISPEDNIAAATAVTPIRSPLGNEFFAPETDAPPAALSGLRKNFDAIDKHDAKHCHREPTVSSHLLCHLEAPRHLLGLHDSAVVGFVARRLPRQQETLGPSNLVAIHILFIVSSLGH